MSWYVYILRSLKVRAFYVGSASDLKIRLKRHNKGRVRSTKKSVPWKIVHSEKYSSRQEAYRRERQIKSYHGGEAFKRLFKK